MRPVVVDAGEALVMAQVQIRLGAVVGDEDLPVLGGAHGAGIDVQIGVEFAQPHLVAARLEQRAERRRGDAFAKGGNHAASDEYKPRHGRPVYVADSGGGKPSRALFGRR